MKALLRGISTLAGLLLLAFTAFIRYSPGLISAGHWKVFFRFGQSASGSGFVMSLPVLMALAVLSICGLLLNRSVRQAAHNLLSDRQRILWVAGALFIWILTMVPLDGAREPRYATSQASYVAILFGSLGVFYLMLGLGGILDSAGRAADRAYAFLLRVPARTLVLACAVTVLVATNLISWLVFRHIPHVEDSVAQVFQARLFAMGRLFAHSPPYPQFFDVPELINNGRWYSEYPFGHSLFLALGVLVRAPWIINPLLGTLAVVVIYFFGREVYDDPTARLGVVLATLSPYLLLMSSEYMSHASALLLAALFLLAYARALGRTGSEPGGLLPALLAGLCLGMVICIRPYTGLLLAVPFAIDAVVQMVRDPKARSRVVVMLGAGAVMVTLLLLYNYFTNGDPLKLGYTVKWGPGHDLGFSQAGWREGYTLARRIVDNSIELYSVNRYLFEWPIPGLAFIVFLFAGTTRNRWDWLLAGTALSLTVGYFFYWWHFITFGPRWQYEALPALVLLTARGMRGLPDFLEQGCRVAVPRERVRVWLGKLLLVCYVMMLAVGLPARLAGYARGGLGVLPVAAKTVRSANIHNAIVFNRRYEETFLQNSIPPGGDIVFARDLGGSNSLLTRQFPGRACFRVSRETLFSLGDIQFERTPTKAGLDSIVAQLSRTDLSGYKTLFWPADELSDMVDSLCARQGIGLRTYRSLGLELTGDAGGVARYLPAIAVWVTGDRADGLAIFTYMDKKADQVLGTYQFRHLGDSGLGAVTLYSIRRMLSGGTVR